MPLRLPLSGGNATRALIALVAVGCCLGAAFAYAAAQPRRQAVGWTPPRPRFTKLPKRSGRATLATFSFVAGAASPAGLPGRFECRLDHAGWSACHSPRKLRGLRPGRHRFSVRAVTQTGTHGASAKFSWRVLGSAMPVHPQPTPTAPSSITGEPFAIHPDLSSLGELYPGMSPEALPVSIVNPNSVTIYVTSLTVSIDPDPAECPGASNFALTPAGVSEASPLAVPAGATVALPTQGVSAPAIAMVDLPTSQDACQGIQLPLSFSGEAHG